MINLLLRAVAYLRRLVAGFPPRRPGFEPGSGHVAFVMDKVALGQVFSEYFCFHCHSFHRLLHTHHHPPSGAGTVGQIVAEVSSGFSLNPPKKKNASELYRPSDRRLSAKLVPIFADRGCHLVRVTRPLWPYSRLPRPAHPTSRN
jgi:hypothetical protein